MRALLSVCAGVLVFLAVGCAQPPEDGIRNAVRETLSQGTAAGEPAPEIRTLAVTNKKRLFWGESVWTAEVLAEYMIWNRSRSEEEGDQEGAVVKAPFRVVITRSDQAGWTYEVRHDRALPGGA